MNRITQLFGVQYPLVQAGMVWCSGWRLASSVSNAGGLGLIGSGSMYPEVLRNQIKKCKLATNRPFGVNIPLLYPQINEHINIVIEENVPVVFTSAGNPARFTSRLKEQGITVVHVVANTRFAIKSEQAGVDAIVAEGFEAGGHNGYEETTTMTLIPMIREHTDLPLLAAGGISSGKSMLAAMALGADGVQVGSRFAASTESSAHVAFKQRIVEAANGDTRLMMKKLVPVRLLKNAFYDQVFELEQRGADKSELAALLGRGRAKLGMFEGQLEEGELEIGQVCALIHQIQPAAEIVEEMINEFRMAQLAVSQMKL